MMPGGISDGDCVTRCSQMPYLRESRHMLANWSAVDRPPPSSSLAAVVEAGQHLVGLLEEDLQVRGWLALRRVRSTTASV